MSRGPLPQSKQIATPPKPGYAALRQHRWSATGAEYFVTVSAQRPATKLAELEVIAAIRCEMRKLETESAWQMRTGVVMPDHVHLLFALRDARSLSECLRLFKGRLSPVLRSHQLGWQAGYYEHRLRPDDDRLPVFLYVFLNPYRAGLVADTAKWRGYYCCDEDWAWFAPLTNSGSAFPAWLV